jgi:hypothetical protein
VSEKSEKCECLFPEGVGTDVDVSTKPDKDTVEAEDSTIDGKNVGAGLVVRVDRAEGRIDRLEERVLKLESANRAEEDKPVSSFNGSASGRQMLVHDSDDEERVFKVKSSERAEEDKPVCSSSVSVTGRQVRTHDADDDSFSWSSRSSVAGDDDADDYDPGDQPLDDDKVWIVPV